MMLLQSNQQTSVQTQEVGNASPNPDHEADMNAGQHISGPTTIGLYQTIYTESHSAPIGLLDHSKIAFKVDVCKLCPDIDYGKIRGHSLHSAAISWADKRPSRL